MSTSSQWGTLREASESWKLSISTIRRMITRGEIEAKRLGPRLIRVNLASIEQSSSPVDIDGYASNLAEGAPPLTTEQRTQLGSIFRGGDA